MFRGRKEVTLVRAHNRRVFCNVGNVFISWIEILNHIQEFINKTNCTIFPPLLWLFHGHYSYQNLSIVRKRKVFSQKHFGILRPISRRLILPSVKRLNLDTSGFLCGHVLLKNIFHIRLIWESDNHILIHFEFCQKQKRYKHRDIYCQYIHRRQTWWGRKCDFTKFIWTGGFRALR